MKWITAISWLACAPLMWASETLETMLDRLIEGTVPQITVPELRLMKPESYVLLDARERDEFQVSHIPGAIWIGHRSFREAQVHNLLRDRQTIVYCSLGKRSEEMGERLRELGFPHVLNLRGGIFEWANHGYPVVTQGGEETHAVHPYNRNWGRWLGDNVAKRYR